MVSTKRLEKYAALAVKEGVNVQQGQLLVITCPVTHASFARLCAKAAYEAGASRVEIDWNDDELTHIHYEYADEKVLSEVEDYVLQREVSRQKKGYCTLHIISDIPDLMNDLDPNKLQTVMMAKRKAMKPYRNYFMANVGQWSIVAVPNVAWAEKVFPDQKGEEAMESLWNAILTACHVEEENNPLADWKHHSESLRYHNDKMNDYNFKSLHFTSSTGTDLTVELVENHIWAGGYEQAGGNKALFSANIPTEETFSCPRRSGVNGKVVATKPLDYQGTLIDNFWLEFKDGKVVRYGAEKGLETLKNLIETDEGSSRLGEVALISYDSPISLSKLLFYNTLFDENASCHLALGDSYPNNIVNGTTMTEEERLAKDCNSSMVHVDFMFGSRDMNIVGVTHDGEEVQVFKDGNFAF